MFEVGEGDRGSMQIQKAEISSDCQVSEQGIEAKPKSDEGKTACGILCICSRA